MLTQARLDELLDLGDATASEARLREAAAAAEDPTERAELETQITRALGLQDRFEEGQAVLREVAAGPAAADPFVRTRLALERGRLVHSAGSPGDALLDFELAATLADRAGAPFLRLDALHMIALAAPQLAEHVVHEALSELETIDDPRTKRWTAPLHRDLGLTRFDGGDLAGAMQEFEAGLAAAEAWGTPQQLRWAREAIEECAAAIASRGDADDR